MEKIDYKKTKKGMTCLMYCGQRSTSRTLGLQMPKYSLSDFRKWCYGQTNFDRLYNNWSKNGYKRDLKPSADRLNTKKGYSFNNIRLITFRENYMIGRDIACRKSKSKQFIEKMRKSLTGRNMLKGKWAIHYKKCKRCSTTKIRHHAKGYCDKCRSYLQYRSAITKRIGK